MKYLLDTNVVSESRKPKPHGAVMDWLASLAPGEIAVCALTFGEMQHGVELTRKQDPAKASISAALASTAAGPISASRSRATLAGSMWKTSQASATSATGTGGTFGRRPTRERTSERVLICSDYYRTGTRD